jgi:DNA-binding winged helix-turn-helix (wHTH) protein
MDVQTKSFYVFEDFTLDIPRKSLWRAGSLVSLTPKALDTLLVLLKYRGLVVDKDTLLSEVWTDTFVEEATLAQNISTLRRVLGSAPSSAPDSAPDKYFIETIPRRGYRFVREVREISAPGIAADTAADTAGDLKKYHEEKRECPDNSGSVPNCIIEINMAVQAVISGDGKYRISIKRFGDDWLLIMHHLKY